MRPRPALLMIAVSILAPPVPSSRAADDALSTGSRGVLDRFVRDKTISGGVILVGDANGTLAEVASGLRDIEADRPMKLDSVFRIASMTKPITAIAVMMLQEEGKLSVEDPVEKYLPSFRGKMLAAQAKTDRKPPARPLSIRDLLTHTSGLPNQAPPGTPETSGSLNSLASAEKAYAKWDLMFEPGSKWSYSNTGITTLGRIVEVVSGKPFEDFLAERLFVPLGMKDTTFYPGPELMERLAVTYDAKLASVEASKIAPKRGERLPSPAGGLYSTAADLAKLYRMMLGKGMLDGKRYLSEASVAEMTRTQTGEIKTGFTEGMSFGFGWGVVKSPTGVTEFLSPGTFGHGGAWGTQAWIDPKRGRFLILMIQRVGLPNSDASDVRREAQRVVFGGK